MKSYGRVSPLQGLSQEGQRRLVKKQAEDQPLQLEFVLRPSEPLPKLDLSRTISTTLFSAKYDRILVKFVLQYFHYLVLGFRLGIVGLAGSLFLDHGVTRTLLLVNVIPASSSLVFTVLFMSVDVLKHLVKSYDFWFTSMINVTNWVAFAALLGDSRAVAAFVGWIAFQIVITVDASFRTFQTATNTMALAIPINIAICAVVMLHSVPEANFFSIEVRGQRLLQATDIIGFTASTLAILLAKMVFLKKRGADGCEVSLVGHYRVPCATVKSTLRLTPAVNLPQALPSQVTVSKRASFELPSPYQQSFMLSRLPVERIDICRTVLPHRHWGMIPPWVMRNQYKLRFVLYSVGAIGYTLASVEAVRVIRAYTIADQAGVDASKAHMLAAGDAGRAVAGALCSTLFCTCLGLFYQRDLLWLLWTNFDYVFSLAQVISYALCVLDMLHWQLQHIAIVWTWTLWCVWALSVDALSPLAKEAIFRLPRQIAPLALAGALVSGLGTVYMVLFCTNAGLQDRLIFSATIKNNQTIVLTTRSIMVGRVATVSIWCTRQVYVLCKRENDELRFIRGLIEYQSPYGIFPRQHNKHIPHIED